MITFTGYSTPQESPPVVYSDATLPFVLPEGIFYQDKIYWKSDVDTQEEINGQELGVIKESVSREEFPTSNLNVTKSAKKYIGDKVLKMTTHYSLNMIIKYYILSIQTRWNLAKR